MGIIPRPLGRGFRSGRRVRVTSASDTRARDASRALVWRPVARLLPCTFRRLFCSTRLWANLSSREPASFFRARRAGGERRAERRALPPKERTMSSSFSALHMDGYVYASPSKRGMSRDDLSDSDDDTQLMDAYNQAVERFREAHDPSGAVAGATALSPGGVGGSRRRQERLDDGAADPSPVAWPRGDQPLVRDDDDRDGHHHDDGRRPPSRSPRTRRVHRETPSPAGGGAMREWNEMSEREREAAWADYYAANGGGDGYQSAGGQQHHQMHHRRHHAEGYYDDAHPSSSPWSEWDAYHHGGDAGVDDHGHYDYGGDPYGRYAPPPPPPRRRPPPPPPRHPYESYHVRGGRGHPPPPGTPPMGGHGHRGGSGDRAGGGGVPSPPMFGGDDAAGSARAAAAAALRSSSGSAHHVTDDDVDELANLLMSWYYAGYYTGSYSRRP